VIAGAVISHGRLEAYVNDCGCGVHHFGIAAYAIAPDPCARVVAQTVCPRDGRVIDVHASPA
jgi:predicted RNA methylase